MHAYPRVCLHLTVTSRGKNVRKDSHLSQWRSIVCNILENKGSMIPRRGLFGHRPTGAQRWGEKHRGAVLDNQRWGDAQVNPNYNLWCKSPIRTIPITKLSPLFFLSFTEIKLEMKPPGKFPSFCLYQSLLTVHFMKVSVLEAQKVYKNIISVFGEMPFNVFCGWRLWMHGNCLISVRVLCPSVLTVTCAFPDIPDSRVPIPTMPIRAVPPEGKAPSAPGLGMAMSHH